jgi:hypothetical protein
MSFPHSRQISGLTGSVIDQNLIGVAQAAKFRSIASGHLTKQSQIRLQALVLGCNMVTLLAEFDPHQPRYLSRIAQRTLRKQVREPLHLAILQG